MPIWLHLILRMVASVICLFGGAILGWSGTVLITLALQMLGARGALVTLLSIVIGVPLFLGCEYLGSVGAIYILDRFPARCPRCRGLSCHPRTDYTFAHRLPIKYFCSACGHVQGTGIEEGGGRPG
jgi:hypothetical protein